MDFEVSILVVSCDRYADLWRPFFTLLWRHWPDNPFRVYLGANHMSCTDPRVKTLAIGDDPGWSTGLRRMLEQVPTPVVLLMLEDFFLRRSVNTRTVFTYLDFLTHLDARMIRLVPRPGPDRRVLGLSFLGEVLPSSPYRISTQGALWQKVALLSLIRDEESIWEFELNGTIRSQNHESGYYCAYRDILGYRHHVVERGKWLRSEARRFGPMDIGCDFARRPIMSPGEDVLWRINKLLAYPKGLIPWAWRQKMMGWFRNGS